MKKNNEFPYIIHACADDYISFPTHTHGLSEIGLPELFIDPYNFSQEWNSHLINDSFSYLTHPEKTDLIPLILEGETVVVKHKTLNPLGPAKDLNICFRVVTHEFDEVERAYDGVEINELAEMRFIKIYIEGDDFDFDAVYNGGLTRYRKALKDVFG